MEKLMNKQELRDKQTYAEMEPEDRREAIRLCRNGRDSCVNCIYKSNEYCSMIGGYIE